MESENFDLLPLPLLDPRNVGLSHGKKKKKGKENASNSLTPKAWSLHRRGFVTTRIPFCFHRQLGSILPIRNVTPLPRCESISYHAKFPTINQTLRFFLFFFFSLFSFHFQRKNGVPACTLNLPAPCVSPLFTFLRASRRGETLRRTPSPSLRLATVLPIILLSPFASHLFSFPLSPPVHRPSRARSFASARLFFAFSDLSATLFIFSSSLSLSLAFNSMLSLSVSLNKRCSSLFLSASTAPRSLVQAKSDGATQCLSAGQRCGNVARAGVRRPQAS